MFLRDVHSKLVLEIIVEAAIDNSSMKMEKKFAKLLLSLLLQPPNAHQELKL